MAYFRRSRSHPGSVKLPGQQQQPAAFHIIGKTTGSDSLLREEGAVALATNLGENGGRGMCRLGNEMEILLFCRPANRRRILDVVTNKVVRFIARVHSLHHAAPTKLEGDACRYR